MWRNTRETAVQKHGTSAVVCKEPCLWWSSGFLDGRLLIGFAGIRSVQCRFPAFSEFPSRLICDSMTGMQPEGSGMVKPGDERQKDLVCPTLDPLISMEPSLV